MAEAVFIPTPTFVKDHTGKRFGRLVVLGILRMEVRGSGVHAKRVPIVLARCDCGKLKEGLVRNMKKGLTKSCGCLQAETRALSGKNSSTHKMTGTPEYRAWHAMRNRCYRPKSGNFALYGGRGISVAKSWRESFDCFYSDVGPRPSPNHSLDRIDVNGNYEPGNVRWATLDVQNTNRRTTVFVDYYGEQISLSEAARRSGVSRSAIGSRFKAGIRGADLFARPCRAI